VGRPGRGDSRQGGKERKPCGIITKKKREKEEREVCVEKRLGTEEKSFFVVAEKGSGQPERAAHQTESEEGCFRQKERRSCGGDQLSPSEPAEESHSPLMRKGREAGVR